MRRVSVDNTDATESDNRSTFIRTISISDSTSSKNDWITSIINLRILIIFDK